MKKDDRLYLGVDVERIWAIVERELPALKKAVREMMR